MVYSGTVFAVYKDGSFQVILDDERIVDNVVPLSVAARRGEGVFSIPAEGDRCVIFFDSKRKPYALFSFLEIMKDDGTMSLSPNYPKYKNDSPNLRSKDFWVGSDSKYICVRSAGSIEIKASPSCGIVLSPAGQFLSINDSEFEHYSTGMVISHTVNSITGMKHLEEYQDTTGVPTGKFYEYIVKDILGLEKASLKVDKLGFIELKLGQVSVYLNTAEVRVNVNEPANTSIAVDFIGNVEVKTNGMATIDGSLIKIGDKASSHAIKGEDLISYLYTHTHSHPTGPTGPPITPPPFSLLATKTLVE